MAKSKSKNGEEDLRGQVRALQKENRELHKILGRLQKRSRNVEELEELLQDMDYQEVTLEFPKINICSCGGKIQKIDLGIRTLLKCVSCGKRETKK